VRELVTEIFEITPERKTMLDEIYKLFIDKKADQVDVAVVINEKKFTVRMKLYEGDAPNEGGEVLPSPK